LNYYNIALIGSILDPLTYQSTQKLHIGSVVELKLQSKTMQGVILEKVDEPSFKCSDVLEISPCYFRDEELKLAKFISNYYICSLGEALNLMVPHKDVKISEENPALEVDIELSTKQKEALRFVESHKLSLLFGDTGSGKTEIYMSYFKKVIDSGERAIFLLPEISLTPQMSKRLSKHFGKSVVFWHSKLTKAQREQNLEAIYSGEAKIVAGPRSALFLPLKNLALIVVDEEHDDSYKSSSKPYYNARDLAIYMGKLYGANVVLGSATPSLNSFYKIPYFRLKGGHFDSKKEFIYEHSYESLTPLVLSSIKQTLSSGSQAIVFVPTRANFKYLLCSSCGEGVKCEHCSVSMSLYSKQNMLKCHYCSATKAIPKSCQKCGSRELVSSRMGSAEVVKNLKEVFSEATIEQFDRDAITTQKKLTTTLKNFNDKKIDILVGTQMLSKGHDYHGVELAVVLGIDNLLNMPDYRSSHKALSTLLQVAGRSGRKSSSKVVVQSLNSEFFSHYQEDFELFLKDELELKKELYPPFKKLARILFSHKNETKCTKAIDVMVKKLRGFSDIEIVGFGKCSIEMVASKHRYEVLLRADKSTSLIKAIVASKVSGAIVDVDPLEFL
jgi:primosomal protein N' (replication factor Y)